MSVAMRRPDIAQKIRPVIWSPQKRQADFMSRPEYEVLYGGAAGGGKTDALLMEATRQVHIPHYRCLYLRKTYPELADVVNRSMELYPRIFPGCKYNDNKHCWRFPSGAIIYFGSINHAKERFKYQGRNFDLIIFDELTHFTYEEYSYLGSRNRPNGAGTRVYRRAGTNPGGIGHAWVKERFITGYQPLTPYFTTYEIEGITYTRHKAFVPATVFDNKILLANDPMYVASLASMPAAEKQALLYGDWDSFAGQAFPEWRDRPEHYKDRRWTHVIEPFKIPDSWRMFRSFDFGYSRPFSVAYWAMDNDGRMYRIRELYGSTGVPNTGCKWTPQQISEAIKRIEREEFPGRVITGVADPSIWDASRGESVAHMMEQSPNYVGWSPGDNKRIPGKMQVHWRLAFDSNGYPMMYVFNTCKAFIRTVPALIYDLLDVEDIDTEGEDHAYDDARYMLMEHPLAPRRNVIWTPPSEDPLNLHRPIEQPHFITF